MPTVFKVRELTLWKNSRCSVDEVLLQFKKSLFVVFNSTAESVNCSLLLKNLEKHFCDLSYKKKNFVKHMENLPQHLSEKFILPITL